MQKISHISKYLLLLVLCCSFLVVRNSGNIEIINLIEHYSNESYVEENYANESSAHQDRPDDTIWTSLGREFSLDHKAQSAAVKAEIRKLLADQNKLYQILEAAAPYIYFIHKQTQTRGLPAEIALIPFVESEFNPNDRSSKGATGLWQLMAGTAGELGVKVRSGYDGRRNVIVSTKAALAYFKDLGKYFNGDWYLAIAAYNAGQGRVKSSMRRAGSKNFWNLRLPRETTLYVPKLLAISAIVKNPEKYGVQLPEITNQPYFATVTVNKSVSLNQVSKSSGISLDTLHKLNPDYKKPGKVTKDAANMLLVPVDKIPVIKTQLQPTKVVKH